MCNMLAKKTDIFAAIAPTKCGMVKGMHEPTAGNKRTSVFWIMGDQDKGAKKQVRARSILPEATLTNTGFSHGAGCCIPFQRPPRRLRWPDHFSASCPAASIQHDHTVEMAGNGIGSGVSYLERGAGARNVVRQS